MAFDTISLASNQYYSESECAATDIEASQNARLCLADMEERQSNCKTDVSKDDPMYASDVVDVQVVNHRIVNNSRKPYTTYTIMITIRFRYLGSFSNLLFRNSSLAFTSSIDQNESETCHVVIDKRFSDIYKLRVHLKRKFSKFFKQNQVGLTIPNRIIFSRQRNFDPSTIEKRAQSFVTFFQTFFKSTEVQRQSLLNDSTVAAFLTDSLRLSSQSRLRNGEFAEAIVDLLSLYNFYRFFFGTDAHPLVFGALMSCVVALACADPQAVPLTVFNGYSASNSFALLLSMAMQLAQRAFYVINTFGSCLFTGTKGEQHVETYRGAIACAIEWLSMRRCDSQVRNGSSHRVLHMELLDADGFSPFANVSPLYKAVLDGNFPW